MREFLPEIIVSIITIIVMILLFVALIFGLSSLENKHDDKLWNDGHCDICGGTWQYEQAVGHRSATSYIYVCDGCGKRIEISEVR